MRVLQLWARLFVASICVYAAALIAVAAGAPQWVSAASMWAVVLIGDAGAVIVIAIILQITTLKRRLSRAVAARRDAVIVTPYDVVEQAFGPLVQARAVRDLEVAVVLRGHQVVRYPRADADGQAHLYEIGSLTKPMTAEVLATMIADGTASMKTRIGDVLADLSLPAQIAEITLEELVSHRSGLPRIPRTFRMIFAAIFSSDPYRWFGERELLRSLAIAHRTAPPGTYSNFGFAVLGLLLGELSGSDYPDALEARLLHPLALNNAYVDSDAASELRHLRGHDLMGAPTPLWHAGAMAGAGGVSMTIADGATWLASHIDPPVAFREAVAMVTRPLAPMGPDRIGMGWIVTGRNGSTVVWHNGGTGGFSSFAAFNPARGVGVIAFAASSHISALDRAGFQVVRECAARWSCSEGSAET